MSPSAHLAVCVFPLQSYEYVSFADTLEKRLMSQQESQCLLHATKKDMRETLSWWLFYFLERATKEWTNQPFAPQKYSLWLSCCVCWLWYFRSTWLLYNAHTNIHTCTQAHTHAAGVMECSSSGRRGHPISGSFRVTWPLNADGSPEPDLSPCGPWWTHQILTLLHKPIIAPRRMSDSRMNKSKHAHVSTIRIPSESVFPIVSTFCVCQVDGIIKSSYKTILFKGVLGSSLYSNKSYATRLFTKPHYVYP